MADDVAASNAQVEQGGEETAKKDVCVFVKKRRPGHMRATRKRDHEAALQDTSPTAVQSRNVRKKHGLTSTSKKEVAAETEKEKEEEEGFAYQSTRSALPVGGEAALVTAMIETETERSKDATAIGKRNLEVGIQRQQESSEEAKVYKGANAYTKYIVARPVSKAARAGPVRAPLHIRMSCRIDYQPDICKDWKETGYCGYGDSCKFMHDRGDYKSGWQLDQEWDEKMKKGTGGLVDENLEAIPEPESDLPWACFICRKPFVNPVVTRCEHYFCEKCALQNFSKSSKCFVCGQQTSGIFNIAHKIIEAIKTGKLKPPPEEEEEKENGEDDEVEPEAEHDPEADE